MVPQRRRGLIAALSIALASVALAAAMLQAQPQSSPVMVAKLTSFSGSSDKGSFEDALEAAIQHAAAAAPGGRPTTWKVTRIAGQTRSAEAPGRVTVTVEARW